MRYYICLILLMLFVGCEPPTYITKDIVGEITNIEQVVVPYNHELRERTLITFLDDATNNQTLLLYEQLKNLEVGQRYILKVMVKNGVMSDISQIDNLPRIQSSQKTSGKLLKLKTADPILKPTINDDGIPDIKVLSPHGSKSK